MRTVDVSSNPDFHPRGRASRRSRFLETEFWTERRAVRWTTSPNADNIALKSVERPAMKTTMRKTGIFAFAVFFAGLAAFSIPACEDRGGGGDALDDRFEDAALDMDAAVDPPSDTAVDPADDAMPDAAHRAHALRHRSDVVGLDGRCERGGRRGGHGDGRAPVLGLVNGGSVLPAPRPPRSTRQRAEVTVMATASEASVAMM
jgi:hypothetical protein